MRGRGEGERRAEHLCTACPSEALAHKSSDAGNQERWRKGEKWKRKHPEPGPQAGERGKVGSKVSFLVVHPWLPPLVRLAHQLSSLASRD